MENFFHWLGAGLGHSFGLSSPFCPLYLGPSLVIAWLWLSRSQKWKWQEAWNAFKDDSRKHMRSIRVDGLWALFQLLFLRAPIAAFHLALFHWAYRSVISLGGEDAAGFTLDHGIEALLATLVTMLAIDLAAYGMHRALHETPWFWWIHRVHHQARFLSPLSTLRQHPLEPFLLNGARGLAAGWALGGLHWLLPNETSIWTIAGMGPGFFLYMFTVNLHHAPVPVQYPLWMRSVLISPHIHHLHHSKAPEHHGKNFGVIFSFWDRWLGTYWDQDVKPGDLEFGVEA